MKHRGMTGLPDEINEVVCSVDIDRKGLPQIRIEVGQSRTVDHQIQVLSQAFAYFGREAEARLSDVTFDNLDAITDETRQLVTVFLVE
jgi:hypothetical protein